MAIKPGSDDGQWTISVMEKSLDDMFGVWDDLILRRTPGHSYLVLKNPEGEIVSAYQGAAFTPITGAFDDGAQSVVGIASTLADQFGLSTLFNRYAQRHKFDLNQPELRVTRQDGPDPFMHKETSPAPLIEHPVLQGSREEMLRRWALAGDAALSINEARLPYYGIGLSWKGLTYGMNCHTATFELL